jgi:hypothetical protein
MRILVCFADAEQDSYEEKNGHFILAEIVFYFACARPKRKNSAFRIFGPDTRSF